MFYVLLDVYSLRLLIIIALLISVHFNVMLCNNFHVNNSEYIMYCNVIAIVNGF